MCNCWYAEGFCEQMSELKLLILLRSALQFLSNMTRCILFDLLMSRDNEREAGGETTVCSYYNASEKLFHGRSIILNATINGRRKGHDGYEVNLQFCATLEE